MKLNLKALSVALAILWAGVVFFSGCGKLNMAGIRQGVSGNAGLDLSGLSCGRNSWRCDRRKSLCACRRRNFRIDFRLALQFNRWQQKQPKRLSPGMTLASYKNKKGIPSS